MYKIYTQSNCVFCIKAKNLLSKKGLKYQEIDINEDPNDKLVLKRLNLKTVPQIWRDDVHIGGYKELLLNLK
tara:strand:- start:2093 stop:2308 length:216 start_codon:yes stop_codon:yes gene_type:complete